MTHQQYPDEGPNLSFSPAYRETDYGDSNYGAGTGAYVEQYDNPDDLYGEAGYQDEPYQDAYDGADYGDSAPAPDRQAEPLQSESVREGDLINIIDRLEDLVLNARSMPFSGNAMVPREEALLLIGLLRDNLPAEIHRANWLLAQNHQVIEEARNMADNIVRQAERREATMINEHEITLRAGELATQTLDQAKYAAGEIRNGALDYADKRLSILEEQLTAMLVTIQKNKKELR